MRKIGIVVKFEYLGYVKAKSFIIMTAILVAILLIVSNIPSFASIFSGVGGQILGGNTKTVIVLGDNFKDNPNSQTLKPDTLEKLYESAEWTDGNAKGIKQRDLKKLIEDQKYDSAIYYDGGTQYEYYARGDDLGSYGQGAFIDELVTEIAKQEALSGLPEEISQDVANISAIAADCKLVTIGGDAGDNFWICYVFSMFLYFVLMMYGNFVSGSVVTEKSSKTMELLITAARPIELMMGKVIGVGLSALTQVAVIIAAAAIGLAFNMDNWKEFSPDIFKLLTESNLSVSLVVFFIIMFLLGYFFYAFIYAALASTVSKPEEAATVSVFPVLLLVAAFMLSFLSFTLSKPIVAVLSYIPPFTPFIMMNRYATGEAGMLSVMIGIVVLAASVLLVAWIAAKIYRVGVMMYGKPMGLITLIKTAMQ